MNTDSKNDVSFQKVLQGILKLGAPVVPVTMAVFKASKKKAVWVSVEEFIRLRTKFFLVECFKENYNEGERRRAIQEYFAVRDLPPAQKFLKESQALLDILHEILCMAAISARKQKEKPAEPATKWN